MLSRLLQKKMVMVMYSRSRRCLLLLPAKTLFNWLQRNYRSNCLTRQQRQLQLIRALQSQRLQSNNTIFVRHSNGRSYQSGFLLLRVERRLLYIFAHAANRAYWHIRFRVRRTHRNERDSKKTSTIRLSLPGG